MARKCSPIPCNHVWCASYLALLFGPLQDPLLDGTLADEAIDGDLFGLTQPVSPVHGLLVHCGVPVAVIEDNLEEDKGGADNIYFLFGREKEIAATSSPN